MGSTHPVDLIIRRQYGVITRDQALDNGFSPREVRTRLETGAWIPVTSGVYSPSTALATWRRQLSAVALSRPDCLVAGRSAARLHGFQGVNESRPEILVPHNAGNPRSPIARVIRGRHFDQVTNTSIEGFRCTSVAETILTLSLREPMSLISRYLDGELAKRSVNITDFNPILDRLTFARQPGLGSLRRVVGERADDRYQPPTTELERLLYALLDRAELPPYVRQSPISYPTLAATVDAYVPDWRLIIEADGRRWHTRREDFEKDRQRDNAALAAGLIVVRLTWKMLRYELESCLRTLLEVGKSRTAA